MDVSKRSVAGEINRLHSSIQDGIKKDEVVLEKLERLVDILRARTVDAQALISPSSLNSSSIENSSSSSSYKSEKTKPIAVS